MTKNGKYLLMCAALTVALLLRYGFGLITPFLLGAALALSAEPVAKRLERKGRFPRKIAAGVSVSLSLLIGVGVTLSLSPLIVNWGIEFGEANKLSSDLNAFAVIGCGFICSAVTLLIELIIEHKVRKQSNE